MLVVLAQEELCKRPAEAPAGAGGENEEETGERELSLGGDHENDAHEDEEDDADEAQREGLEAEEEGKYEDKYEGGVFDHC